MKLIDIFKKATADADRLCLLYDALLTKNQRDVRPEWAKRFFDAKLKPWARRDGLWRSENKQVLIVGKKNTKVNHMTFNSDALAVLLRSSLLLHMAAVDKILHEALLTHFSELAKVGDLDDLVQIRLSRAYAIAQEARERTGAGGKVRKRPGHPLKAEMLEDIYKDSYLNPNHMEKVCAACNKGKIFTLFGKEASITAEAAKSRWSKLYMRRNQIAHECDIVRKARAKRVDFHDVRLSAMREDIAFIRQFGEFLAKQLS